MGRYCKKSWFWNTAQGEKVDFKDWKFIKNSNLKQIRKKYRDYVADKALDFINKDNSDALIISPEVLTDNVEN